MEGFYNYSNDALMSIKIRNLFSSLLRKALLMELVMETGHKYYLWEMFSRR
jgi:hypothetical protein